MSLPKVLDFAHRIVGGVVRPGDLAVDATVGNGHDTRFLAEAVGATGQVLGFDVQAAAIEATRARLRRAQLEARVRLVHAGHETLPAHLPVAGYEAVRAVMFNLGYLPGADKTCVTRPATTRSALEAALPHLAPGGVLTVVAYPGHAGGAEEAAQVEDWAQRLHSGRWSAAFYRRANQPTAPWLLAVVPRA